MGLFNRKKKVIEKTVENKKIELDDFELPIYGSDEVASIYDVRKVSHARHRGGRECDVYICRVLEHGINDAIIPDYGDYICFELNPELKKEILSSVESRDEFMTNVAAYYLYGLSNKDRDNKFYLGEIIKNEEQKRYMSKDFSDTVKRYFENYVAKQEALIEQEYNKYNEEARKNDFINSLKIKEAEQRRHENYLKNEELIKQRANTPYLEIVNRYMNNKDRECFNYDGINVSGGDERGYILRIRQLENRGIDGSGTYLYSGYICSTGDESDVEFNDYRTSTAVCFELYRSLENIVEDNNPQEIQNVLNFLSNPNNFKNNDKLNYIGHLDRITEIQPNGEIKRTVVERRLDESDSPAIAAQIKIMQQEFDRENGQSR